MKRAHFIFLVGGLGVIFFIFNIRVRSKTVTVTAAVDLHSLSADQAGELDEEPGASPVQIKREDGKYDTVFVLSSSLAGKKFPLTATKNSSLCGCSVSYTIK